MSLPYAEQAPAVKAAIATFQATFGLRAFPGETFRIGASQSYYSDTYGIMLYTQRQDGDRWLDFAKGTPEELRRQIVNK